MVEKKSDSISVFELYACRVPLRFFERCAACVRFQDNCSDLALGIELLRRKKTITYAMNETGDNQTIHANSFTCTAPLAYFEHTRNKCAHRGRCREEGLLLALLNRKKSLDYSHKEVIELPMVRRQKVVRPARLKPAEVIAAVK
jgi:hypothetical protein